MKTGESGKKLGTILRETSIFVVEDYQRSYSWEREQVEDYLSDLTNAVDPRVERHFFGTLILQDKESEPGVVNVVDGQQRLTTVFITLAAIRDAVATLKIQELPGQAYGVFPSRPGEDAAKIIYSGDAGRGYRFVPNRFVRNIVKQCIFADLAEQKELPKVEKKTSLALRHAARQIRAFLEEYLKDSGDDEAKLRLLEKLLVTLLDKFFVLKIETSNLSESLEVFLTLNDRGQTLGPSDIVKGKIMSSLGYGLAEQDQIRLQETINEEWEQLKEDVVEPETFLRHYLVSLGDEKVQKKKVVDLVVKKMSSDPGSNLSEAESARKFWISLKEASFRYAKIVALDFAEGEARYQIGLLEGLQKSHRIALLQVLESKTIFDNPDSFNEIVRLLFVLSFRWAAAEKSRQGLEDTFQMVAKIVRGDNPQGQKSVEEELTQFLIRSADEVEVDFTAVFERGLDGSFISRAALHYAQRLSASNSIELDIKTLHLEHIAPQKETAQWLRMVFGTENEKYVSYENLKARAGNLTLLDPGLNTKIGNKPFAEKRLEYKRSVMYLTNDLARFEIWDERLIDARTKWLAEVFTRVCSTTKNHALISSFFDWHSESLRG